MHQLAVKNSDFEAISPAYELAAYEALWESDDSSVKTISQQLKLKEYKLLSDMVRPEIIKEYLLKVKEYCKDINFNVCLGGEADYPPKLLDATYSIPFFYYKGALDLIHAQSIAVVGTRNASLDGIRRTQKITRLLVNDGYTIISGLAKGIDTAAHKTAIECGGHTIAVIGTPINTYYPSENKFLQDNIAKNHLLISQVPILKYNSQDYRKNRFFFPERNKTMSAISKATVIVEAGETSGTLIQAREALKQGRKVFILDSCFENGLDWALKLQAKGAIRIKEYEALLYALKEG